MPQSSSRTEDPLPLSLSILSALDSASAPTCHKQKRVASYDHASTKRCNASWTHEPEFLDVRQRRKRRNAQRPQINKGHQRNTARRVTADPSKCVEDNPKRKTQVPADLRQEWDAQDDKENAHGPPIVRCPNSPFILSMPAGPPLGHRNELRGTASTM